MGDDCWRWNESDPVDEVGYEVAGFNIDHDAMQTVSDEDISVGYGDREHSFACTVEMPSDETKPSDVLKEVAEEQQAKNADYGDSWQKTGELKEVLAGGELPHIETANEAVMDGLYTRMLDKLSRGYTLAFLNDGREVDDEALADTFRDLAGYAAMAAAEFESSDNEDSLSANNRGTNSSSLNGSETEPRTQSLHKVENSE